MLETACNDYDLEIDDLLRFVREAAALAALTTTINQLDEARAVALKLVDAEVAECRHWVRGDPLNNFARGQLNASERISDRLRALNIKPAAPND